MRGLGLGEYRGGERRWLLELNGGGDRHRLELRHRRDLGLGLGEYRGGERRWLLELNGGGDWHRLELRHRRDPHPFDRRRGEDRLRRNQRFHLPD
jgi:hypothetical protein